MRMSNTNNFSASFNVATPYQMVVIHSSKLIYPRELYQRGIQRIYNDKKQQSRVLLVPRFHR